MKDKLPISSVGYLYPDCYPFNGRDISMPDVTNAPHWQAAVAQQIQNLPEAELRQFIADYIDTIFVYAWRCANAK